MTETTDDIKEVENGTRRMDMLYQKYTGTFKQKTRL
jgi:hypothetical protein